MTEVTSESISNATEASQDDQGGTEMESSAEQSDEHAIETPPNLREEFGDRLERLFKKAIWEVVPEEFMKQDSNRPKKQYKDLYYSLMDKFFEDIMYSFEESAYRFTDEIEEASKGVALKEKIENAMESGNTDLLKRLDEEIDNYQNNFTTE